MAFNCHAGENQAPRETEANHYIVITISLFVPNSRSGVNSVTSVHLAHAGLRGTQGLALTGDWFSSGIGKLELVN